MTGRVYIETFDDGPGGWTGQEKQGGFMRALERGPSSVIARSPFMLDSNHAPPGAGYLQILAILLTKYEKALFEQYFPYSGMNRFVEGGHPRDFRNARLTLRLRGELQEHGAKLVLLAQSKLGEDHVVNYVLTGQPFDVTPDWSEQTVTLTTDADDWTCLGGRWDKGFYGYGPIEDVLRDVNIDIILVTFPCDVLPMEPLKVTREAVTQEAVDVFAPGRTPPPDLDPRHALWAGRNYKVDTSRLPEGWVEIDEVRVEFQED